MLEKFKVEFLPEAVDFMESLDKKSQEKIYYNIRKVQVTTDPELFKKLTGSIWEFRTLYNKTYYRLFAFWDKIDGKQTLVLATHGLIKKTGKTPLSELDKAEKIRQQYFDKKNSPMHTKKKMKTVSLDKMIDKHIGKIGTAPRNSFEQELKLDLLGYAIKEARLHHNLTQEQLGKLVGVQKAQISKLENNFTNARFDTVIKVFNALHAKVNFKVELPKTKLSVA